ncbi:MAG: hypothetical protein NTW46_02220 [Candidatus Nealsonbacteria bacterium]|nr:hypothetical protein [Candidatus Nealsonbacteria bacterium]
MIILAVVKTDADAEKVSSEIKAANASLLEVKIDYYENLRTFKISYPENICFEEIEKRLASCKGLATFFEFSS